MSFTVTKSLSTDFPSGLDAGQLHAEILASSIATVLEGINTDSDTPDDVLITFVATPSGAELTTLDAVIAAHVPQPRPTDLPLTLTYGRDSTTVTGGSYLRGPGAVSSAPGAAAPALPTDRTLVGAVITVDGAPSAAWSVEIQADGVTKATIVGTSSEFRLVDATLTTAFNKDNQINVRTGPTSATVAKPVVVLLFEDR